MSWNGTWDTTLPFKEMIVMNGLLIAAVVLIIMDEDALCCFVDTGPIINRATISSQSSRVEWLENAQSAWTSQGESVPFVSIPFAYKLKT